MLETKAVFNHKDAKIEAKDCVIEKVIRLSGWDFDAFSRNMMRDHDFIKDNVDLMHYDAEGKRHCLLAVGDGQRDGILIDSSGYDYARYSAFIPNAEDFLTVGQYPALAELNKKLTDIVDYIAGQALLEKSSERVLVDIEGLESQFSIDLTGTLINTVMGMLNERSEIGDLEIDNNDLILYRESDFEPPAEDLSDPSFIKADMYAYGYSFEGMIPVGQERALELFDKEWEVYLLYQDDTECAAESREDILSHDGMFGIGDPTLEIIPPTTSIEVFILNREKYEKGETSGEWLKLPVLPGDLMDMFKRIGVDRPSEGAFSITAVRMPLPDLLREHVSKYDSLDELNMLASFIAGMEDFELTKLQAILVSGVKDIGGGTTAIINTLCDENFDAFRMIDAADYETLGRYWEGEIHDKPEDVSFEEYGRQIVADEKGKFTEWGYIYFRYKELLPEYTGVVPNEYQITGMALHGLRQKAQERGSEEEKPSVIGQIRAAKKAPQTPKEPRDHKKNKGGPDL